MRIIPPSLLEPGMAVGKNIYGRKNELLLTRGHILSRREIERLVGLHFQAVFIREGEDDEPECEEPIGGELKNSAVCAVRELFCQMEDEMVLNGETVKKAMCLVQEMVDEIILDKNASITMNTLRLFDDYTYYHSVNVAIVSIILGVAMNLSRQSLYKLGLGALLHDMGKIFVEKEILDKNGRLSDEEFEKVKVHCLKGHEYLKKEYEIPSECCMIVLTHHEKYDGSGYPFGLADKKIPSFGKITAIADVFDALTSDRPYRKALPPSEAVEYILGGSGTHFDPSVVEAFLQKISVYPIGTAVILSNGQTGTVVGNTPRYPTRPKVKVPTGEGAKILDLCGDERCFDITVTGLCYT